MATAQVEYVGFSTQGRAREYKLRVRVAAGDSEDFTLAIPCEAFVAHRVRYQDAPEICFLKLQRELSACGDGRPAAHLDVSDADLEEYRAAHAPKPAQRRPRPPVAPAAPIAP